MSEKLTAADKVIIDMTLCNGYLQVTQEKGKCVVRIIDDMGYVDRRVDPRTFNLLLRDGMIEMFDDTGDDDTVTYHQA